MLASSLPYALVLLPPLELARTFAALRARFDPEHAAIQPHVTLKQPFCFSHAEIDETTLVAALADVCAAQPRFELELEGVGQFTSPAHGQVVYAAVRPCAELLCLVEAFAFTLAKLPGVQDELKPSDEVSCYLPHLTLAQELSVRAADVALRALQAEVGRSTFAAHAVYVSRRRVDGVWETPHVLALGAERFVRSA